MQKKGEDVGNTLDFQTSNRLGEDGFNGLDGTKHHFNRAGFFFGETL